MVSAASQISQHDLRPTLQGGFNHSIPIALLTAYCKSPYRERPGGGTPLAGSWWRFGGGGMGEVYRARGSDLVRDITLKISLRISLQANGPEHLRG